MRNCIIGENGARFDFGVIALNSKSGGRFGHRIHNNEIHARDSAITLLRVDDMRVNDNVITWSHGFGISFARDSDRNRINSNAMSSVGSATATFRLVPGGPFRTGGDDAIFLVNVQVQPLYNVVIGRQLYQFPNSEDGQYPSHDDNVIEGNHLFLPGSSEGKTHTAIEVGTNARRSRVTANMITQGGVGIRLAGLLANAAVSRAARCVNPAGQALARYCRTDADCFIPQIDDAALGTCPPLITDIRDLSARDSLVEDNVLIGPFNSPTAMRAAIFGGNGTVGGMIRGNRIVGTGIEPGIVLAGNMFQTGEVSGNVVHNAAFALMLQQGSATVFGARVSLNDFTGTAVQAVGVTGLLTVPVELSADGVGNYWGHAAPPCFKLSDSPIPELIQDTNPFCVRVAASASPRRP